MFNVVRADNWKSSQKDDEMIPFGLANAPKALQKMVLGFYNFDAPLQSHDQDGNQDEVFFDVVDEF